MEAGSFLALQHDGTDLLAALEKQSPLGDFVLVQGDEKSPKGLDTETYPREVGVGSNSKGPQQEVGKSRTFQNEFALSFRNEPERKIKGPPQVHIGVALPRRNDSEEIITYISENTTVTSADEEKLLLLNKNTELRRINKELLKLNQDWDFIYHSTSLGLQHKVGALQEEVAELKLQAQNLSAKLEHEQNKKEYYEQALFQELKRNQALQEYIRHLERRQLSSMDRQPDAEPRAFVPLPYEDFSAPQHTLPGKNAKENIPNQCHLPSPATCDSKPKEHQCLVLQSVDAAAEKEVSDLKEHLEALKCQTEIFEADYRTEQKDQQRIKAENTKLRQKEEEMRQQMALLQEQLKIFEDDFRKERLDKQVLQRLLKGKPDAKKPVLPHHCRNQEKPLNSSCSCSCHKNHHRQ